MKASNFHCRSMIVKLLAGSALTLFAGALRAEEPSQHGVPRDQKMIDQKLIDDTRKNSDQAVRDREEAVKQAARDKREQAGPSHLSQKRFQ